MSAIPQRSLVLAAMAVASAVGLLAVGIAVAQDDIGELREARDAARRDAAEAAAELLSLIHI